MFKRAEGVEERMGEREKGSVYRFPSWESLP
jgi:hypothetical protein